MINVYDLVNNVDVQVAIHFYYYDYDKDERIEITQKEAMDKEIKYMYCENNEICIEIESED